MSDQAPNHPSEGSKPESEPQTEHESEFEGFAAGTSHFYEDGNISLDVRGTIFKVHKSILALHSEVFRDMFSLTHVQPADGPDEPIHLDDDPKAFHILLDAIYKGAEFIRKANILQFMDAIKMTHKYQMSGLEACLQDYIMDIMLPCSAVDGAYGAKFHLYDTHPGLDVAVLRFGADALAPWAFYKVGVGLFSKINIGDTSTYGPPPIWFALDPEFAYSFFVLRQIVNDAFENWEKKISNFYTSVCLRMPSGSRSTTSNPKCARQVVKFGSGSPLYISGDQKRVDPVGEMAPRMKNLDTVLADQKDTFHSGWCFKCNTSIKEIASSVISDMYPQLVDCTARMDRMKLRDIPEM
ncbi:unnamed protein product [Rhizoctonia solani]|uniref:BTB domain-containing protein n=3 Tax=Rhizoctonia solani TaxID=456999 RepID=A0A8H3DFR2_9AGAM|nr:BTB/POZ domain protein [Rhizoctonia solani AG-3 Rhs1AP]KEP53463.1 BTB/POZ domain protein [Rhizoctonia solani 123E]CAE6523738.1 unnamed protein product [Rhizoctonia solani]